MVAVSAASSAEALVPSGLLSQKFAVSAEKVGRAHCSWATWILVRFALIRSSRPDSKTAYHCSLVACFWAHLAWGLDSWRSRKTEALLAHQNQCHFVSVQAFYSNF